MMLLFSSLLLLVIALIASVCGGILCSVVAWLIVRKRALRFKWLIVLFAAISPALVIGMEIVLGLIGSVYISETKGVDLGYGDYWEAPLTESHSLYAIDTPESAYIRCRENDIQFTNEGYVRHLWVADDSVIAACSTSDTYLLLVFHIQDRRVDTLLLSADSLQFAETLQSRNLAIESALTPDDYFSQAQNETHKTERLIRHTIVIVILLALWCTLIRLAKSNKKIVS